MFFVVFVLFCFFSFHFFLSFFFSPPGFNIYILLSYFCIWLERDFLLFQIGGIITIGLPSLGFQTSLWALLAFGGHSAQRGIGIASLRITGCWGKRWTYQLCSFAEFGFWIDFDLQVHIPINVLQDVRLGGGHIPGEEPHVETLITDNVGEIRFQLVLFGRITPRDMRVEIVIHHDCGFLTALSWGVENNRPRPGPHTMDSNNHRSHWSSVVYRWSTPEIPNSCCENK